MRALHIMFMACLAGTLWFACSSGSGDPDSGVDSGNDAGVDAEDAGSDPGSDPGADPGTDAGVDADGGQQPDYDPAGSFLITVPPGVSLCSTFNEGREWEQELEMLGRIDLAPGYYVLPRQTGYHPASFVSAAPFGPDRTEPVPVADGGEFNAVYYDWPWGAESWEYTYEQEYTLSGQPFRINVYFSFYSEDGQWPAEQITDNDFQMTGTAYIGPGEDWITEQQPYSNCESLPAYSIDALTQGGDRIVLDKRHCWACACAGNTSCYNFYSAVVEMGSYSTMVADHFSLVYSAGHHNEGEVFLIFLAEPAGDVGALRVHAPPLASPEGGVVFYLDGNLGQIRSEDLTQWEVSY